MRSRIEEDDNKYSGKNYHQLVNYRAYMLHTSLFLFVKDKIDLESFLEFSTNEKYFGTI